MMKTLSILLALSCAALPTAQAERAALSDLFPAETCTECSGAVNAAVDRPAAYRSVASKIEIERVPGGFTVDGFAREPLEVRLVRDGTASEAAPEAQMLGLWTGGRVMYGYACDAHCTVIVQKRGQGEILQTAGL